MASKVFVDTGAWVALRYARDAYHERSRGLLVKLRKEKLELVTSDWVFAEAVTLLKARGAVDHALELGDALRQGKLGQVVASDPARGDRAWELFRKYRDQRVGFVDCTSFAIMQELKIRVAFGFDRDFVAAGFGLYG